MGQAKPRMEDTKMLKRILALLAVMTLLCASAALAEDLSSLTDRELMKLYLDVVDEMRNRTAAEQENAFHEIKVPHDVEFEADMDVINRLYDFFAAWKDNNYNDMIEICAPEWIAKNDENPKNALFTILQNRTPESVQVETISGNSESLSRQVNILVLMNYNNQKDSVLLRMTTIMVREDGIWYINPECLLSFKPVNGN